MAEWAGVVSAVIAVIGLGAIVVQLRGAGASSRAQATIQFQEAFRRSKEARDRLQSSFPVHISVVEQLASEEEHAEYCIWNERTELSADQESDAEAVVGALNDVAQYVVDGLALRSALQQYHTIFIRVGVLLLPYLEQRNARVAGLPQARYGYRIVDLYNAGIAYHRIHHKHRGRELTLRRPAANGPGMARLVLLHPDGSGVVKHDGFGSESRSTGPRALYRGWKLRRVVKRAERKLRR